MTKRVVITGMGCVSAIGLNLAESWTSLIESQSGIADFERVVKGDGGHRYGGPAALVKGLSLDSITDRFGERATVGLDPFTCFALPASVEALDQAGLVNDPALARAAILYGAGGGGLSSLEEGYERLFIDNKKIVHPLTIPRFMPSAAASQLSMVFGIRGPCFAISSACSSSAHAVAESFHMIRTGRVAIAVAGGSEAPMTYGHWLAWKAIRAMADDTCRPFAAGRKGMILGEGAATLVLEERDHALARGATILAEIVAGVCNSDAHHLTQPQGDGAILAMEDAYAQAGLHRDTPVLVSAHGTGTAMNDRVEAAALRNFYGDAIDDIRIIATKSAHGHLIGATGALEFVLGLKALMEKIAPPILNYDGVDPECSLPLVVDTPESVMTDVLVSNTFAFGGLNGVLIARRVS
jgi:nodulation protein E